MPNNLTVKKTIALTFLVGICLACNAQLPRVWQRSGKVQPADSTLVKRYIYPQAIAWQSDGSGELIANERILLAVGNGQASLVDTNYCRLKSLPGKQASILLDFGREIFGGIKIITGYYAENTPAAVRIRFGESYSEAMSDVTNDKRATNDHAMRDFSTHIPWLGSLEVGNTGFRFVRIDLLDTQKVVFIKEIAAAFTFRDIPYAGSFKCNDTLLNKIWETGAYTVHLNMQTHLWDGIKRDQLAWMGDMSLETKTVFTVFGNHEIVPRTLDLIRNETPLPQWMNTLSSFSLWWPYIQHNLYMHGGDLAYLKQQEPYLTGLVNQMTSYIKENGEENLPSRFFDWPSSTNKPAIHAGLQSLMVISLESSSRIFGHLHNTAMQTTCDRAVARLRTHVPDPNKSLQAAAMMGLAGLKKPDYINKTYFKNTDYNGISPFMGYYILQNKALANDYRTSLDFIRYYWGAMLKLGATTFWEDLQTEDLPNAGGIDKAVPPGKTDIHGDCGEYCYIGFRHSLCHGWASGPTPWLTEHVLGIRIMEPGCKVIRLSPNLGDLTWAEGTFPTPKGVVSVSHRKVAGGRVETEYKAPAGIQIIVSK